MTFPSSDTQVAQETNWVRRVWRAVGPRENQEPELQRPAEDREYGRELDSLLPYRRSLCCCYAASPEAVNERLLEAVYVGITKVSTTQQLLQSQAITLTEGDLRV